MNTPAKDTLKAIKEQLYERFALGRDVRLLVREWADAVDGVLRDTWSQCGLDHAPDLTLVAVGGYGRAELLPCSDVDVLVLHRAAQLTGQHQELVSQFITALWDLGLDLGSSVRSLDDCVRLARDDITIATNLMESRTLVGDDELRVEMQWLTGPDHVWPGDAFFIAKRDEQQSRHHKHNNTEYNLEPDLKNAPGGLRDIQTIGWVAKRHFGAQTLKDLVIHGFLSEAEFDEIDECQATLWRIRFVLNKVTGRNETRILFDYQRRVAEQFGFVDTPENRGVEKLMQDYYRAAMRISILNEVLLQYFDEVILKNGSSELITPINSRFHIRNGTIEVTSPEVFTRYPSALLEIFVLLGDQPEPIGIRASTIRLLMQSVHLIDEDYRQDIRHRSLFMELIRCKTGLFSQLRRMKRYGVLGRYIPAFGDIIGKMQYDLFHIYTVDAHTLRVVKNMRQFSYLDNDKEFPVVAEVARSLPKIELLYLAGLFHDIAKGRGGDHSELGAHDAQQFCTEHGLGRWDANLVAWLAQHHLVMSMTAQKKDVSDPDVINEFAQIVGDVLHLNYLYALTVADICATNPTLWNSWRASLLRQLYTQTKRALYRGLENPIDKQEWINETRASALELLKDQGLSQSDIERIWDELGDDYFLRESAKDIAWHTAAILQHRNQSEPLVLMRESHTEPYEGAGQIFVYTKDMPNLFAATVAALDQLSLTVLDARIITSASQFSLDTYIVLDQSGERITERERLNYIVNELRHSLADPDNFPDIVHRRLPRQLKHFEIRTEVSLSNDITNQRTAVEIITLDRPGLLARIGRIFMDENLTLQTARIATLGERAEDVFFVTDAAGQPLSDLTQCQHLIQTLRDQLDQNDA